VADVQDPAKGVRPEDVDELLAYSAQLLCGASASAHGRASRMR
jgi:hypothetical protein